jgi:hypothetical protein
MANTINLIDKYVPILDEVYKRGLLTSDLEGNTALVRESMDANAILIPKVSTQGLADYDKASGFVSGDATLTWETYTFTQDRGRSFTIDNADNMETAGVAYSALGSDFVSTNVVPETDAYRFATLYSNAGTTANANLDATTVDAAIDTAAQTMDEANVPEEGRILYVSPTVYTLIKQSDNFSRDLQPGQSPNRNFGMYDGMQVVKVPQSRFYSAITLYDGTTGGEEAGGYIKDAVSGYDLNFVIVHPSAVVPITKISKTRVFSPSGENGLPVNQDADAWKFQQRVYHDCFVLANRVDGIYAHTVAQV